MIKKIVCFLLPIFLVIAVFLKFNGVDKIEFNDTYYNFMSSVLQRNNAFTLAIPNIPNIPVLTSTGVGWDILKTITNFANGLINLLNVLVTIINALLSVLQFVLNIIIQSISELRKIVESV